MRNRPQPFEMVAATVEEVAAWLSISEGREVTIQEVRRIEALALRKVRQSLRERGLSAAELLPER